MCIIKSSKIVAVKTGRLQLWKVIRSDNHIGIWLGTYDVFTLHAFQLGVNVAKRCFMRLGHTLNPQFHCFFTRKAARKYIKFQKEVGSTWFTKIIKVYADSKDVVLVGVDDKSRIPAISVSKMEIKSLAHQR